MPASSNDDADPGSDESPPIRTQRSYDDDGMLDLDNTLRRQRDAFRKQRMEKMTRRREESQREVVERSATRTRQREQLSRGKSKRRNNNDDDDDDDDDAASASSGGSADLLADASPAPSLPSPPNSPQRTLLSRSSNNRSSRTRESTTAKAKVDSKSRSYNRANSDASPSSILKSKKSGADKGSPSPSRVAWKLGGTTNDNKKTVSAPKPWKPKYDSDSSSDDGKNNTTTRYAHLTTSATNTSNNTMANSLSQLSNPWKPKYDSDSDDDTTNIGKSTNNAVRSLSQLGKPWKPKHDSDSDDYNDTGKSTNNAVGSLSQLSKPWKPKYDSDSSDVDEKERNNSNNAMNNSLSQMSKPWKPKYGSDSDDDEIGTNTISTKAVDAGKNSSDNSASSPAQRKRPWKPKYDSDSDNDNDKMNDRQTGTKTRVEKSPLNGMSASNVIHNTTTTTAKKRSSPLQRKNPLWNRDDDSSDSEDDGKMAKDIISNKVTTERRTTDTTKSAAQRKFAFDSDSSSDEDIETMRKRLRERNEERERKSAATAAAKSSYNVAAAAFSPLEKTQQQLQRPSTASTNAAIDLQGRRFAHLSDDSDDDDDNFLAETQRLMQQKKAAEQARLQAEKEASYKHNPLAMEKRDRDERNDREKRLSAASGRGSAAGRTNAGAGGLEGTEIVLKDDEEEEIKSISDMGDEACRRGKNKPLAALEDSAQRKPSRGAYKRHSWRTNDNDTSDDDGSPSKKQRHSNQSSLQNNRSRMQLSDDDGLWDDSDQDAKKNANDSSDSDGGAKKKGKRGRPKASRSIRSNAKKANDTSVSDDDGNQKGKRRDMPRAKKNSGSAGQQSRKRSTSNEPKAASKAAADGSDGDDDSELTDPEEKQTTKKNTRRRRQRSSSVDSDGDNAERKKRSSNGSSRWNSRYGDDDQSNEKSASDDELERLEGKLKPEFADPKLGAPGPLVPFTLSKTLEQGDPLLSPTGNGDVAPAPMEDNADIDKVPASINRYLQEYQRAGIQFMYSSVIQDKGCVLGDDMGLGKTVQLISLIAALLTKTGTGLDELEIKRHRNKIVKALKAKEESKHHALLYGTGFGVKGESAVALNADVKMPSFTPILIVVPPSVAQNWQNEFKTWGHFNVGVYSGTVREKALDRIKDGLDSILIVGKSLFVRAGDYDQLASVEWKLVIVDEFHEFKNGKSQGYMRLADLRDNARCPIIGMTGTLMQNNHDELYYLIDLVRPNLLGDIRQFRNEVSRPINYARAKDAKNEVMKLAEQQENLLRDLIRPAFIERKKEDVLKGSLTKKNEKVIFCELSMVQKRIYRHILSLPDFQQLRFANAPCECGVNKAYFMGYAKMRTHKEQLNYQRRHKEEIVPQKKCCYKYPFNPLRGEPGEPQIDPNACLWIQAHEKPIGNMEDIEEDVLDGKYIVCQACPTCITFAAMNKLYKVASHPALLQVDHCESGAAAKKKLQFAKIALTPDVLRELPGGTYWKSDGIMDDHMKLSGKMKSLDYLLRRYLRRRNRVLVFSYSTASLDVIQNHIKTRGWTSLRLDGQTPTSQRQSLVDQFQNGDIEIFLISTKAGGLGLNLTAANKVIIFDVNWNPSYDEQAQDRAYRIGQKRDVDTVRLVARGTIEELIYARQVYKVQLKKQTLGHNTGGKNQPQIFRGVAKDKNRKGELFGLENLLKFKDGSFMSALWKKTDDPQQEHDMTVLADQIENMDEKKLDSIAEEGDEAPKDTRLKPRHPQQDSSDEYDGNGKTSNDGMNHQHLFNDTKGGARIGKDDAGFNEEMGGESQVCEVATKLACEKYQYEKDEDEPDLDDPDSLHESAATPSNDGGRDSCPSPTYSTGNPLTDKNDESSDKLTPDRSTSDQSVASSIDELRTQPTTQHPSPSQKAPSAKKRETSSKISIMGNVFENQPKKKKGNQLAKKKYGGLYIPSYSRK